jgi:hypothetical protein
MSFFNLPGFFQGVFKKAGADPDPWLDLSGYTGAFPPGVGAPTPTGATEPWNFGLPDQIGQQAIYNGELWVQTAADASLQASWELGTADNANEVLYDNSGSGLAATQVQAAVDELDGRIDTLEAVVIPYDLVLAASDESTDLTTGIALTFRMPRAMTVTEVRTSTTTAATGATLLEVDILEGGVSILFTNITQDAGEKTSVTATTPPVISDSALADNAEITIDIVNIGNTTAGQGLKVYLIGTPA